MLADYVYNNSMMHVVRGGYCRFCRQRYDNPRRQANLTTCRLFGSFRLIELSLSDFVIPPEWREAWSQLVVTYSNPNVEARSSVHTYLSAQFTSLVRQAQAAISVGQDLRSIFRVSSSTEEMGLTDYVRASAVTNRGRTTEPAMTLTPRSELISAVTNWDDLFALCSHVDVPGAMQMLNGAALQYSRTPPGLAKSSYAQLFSCYCDAVTSQEEGRDLVRAYLKKGLFFYDQSLTPTSLDRILRGHEELNSARYNTATNWVLEAIDRHGRPTDSSLSDDNPIAAALQQYFLEVINSLHRSDLTHNNVVDRLLSLLYVQSFDARPLLRYYSFLVASACGLISQRNLSRQLIPGMLPQLLQANPTQASVRVLGAACMYATDTPGIFSEHPAPLRGEFRSLLTGAVQAAMAIPQVVGQTHSGSGTRVFSTGGAVRESPWAQPPARSRDRRPSRSSSFEAVLNDEQLARLERSQSQMAYVIVALGINTNVPEYAVIDGVAARLLVWRNALPASLHEHIDLMDNSATIQDSLPLASLDNMVIDFLISWIGGIDYGPGIRIRCANSELRALLDARVAVLQSGVEAIRVVVPTPLSMRVHWEGTALMLRNPGERPMTELQRTVTVENFADRMQAVNPSGFVTYDMQTAMTRPADYSRSPSPPPPPAPPGRGGRRGNNREDTPAAPPAVRMSTNAAVNAVQQAATRRDAAAAQASEEARRNVLQDQTTRTRRVQF